jgi:hypothetical protein
LPALRTRVRRVLVAWAPATAGAWHADRRLITIDRDHLAEDAPHDVAATLIHELTHVNLDRLGVACATTHERARCEWICLRAEIRFIRRLPVGESVLGGYRRRLDRLSLRSYDAAAIRRRAGAAARARLRLELPPWLFRLVARLWSPGELGAAADD